MFAVNPGGISRASKGLIEHSLRATHAMLRYIPQAGSPDNCWTSGTGGTCNETVAPGVALF